MTEKEMAEAVAMLERSNSVPDSDPGGFDLFSALVEAENQLSTVRRTTLGVVRELIEKGQIQSQELEGLLYAEELAKERWRQSLNALNSYEERRRAPWGTVYGISSLAGFTSEDSSDGKR